MAQDSTSLSPNQVVATVLRDERKARGWTWEKVCHELGAYGISWEKTTYYAAEASRLPDSAPRRFSADEILAFALIFDKPATWFLTPPEGVTMTMGTDPLYFRDLLALGLHRELADLRPLAERLREVATAIETFEEGRQPKSGAQQISEFVQDVAMRDHPERYGETGHRRTEKENEKVSTWRLEQARTWIRNILAAEDRLTLEDLQRELEQTLSFFSDVVPPPEEALGFIEEIRAEMQADEEKETGA